MKGLIDSILAREFDAADFEFAWTPVETIDPQAQEQVLSSYTSRGILTLNEARAVLGRQALPLMQTRQCSNHLTALHGGLLRCARKDGVAIIVSDDVEFL